jgi:glucose/arabinose dehydrogenase
MFDGYYNYAERRQHRGAADPAAPYRSEAARLRTKLRSGRLDWYDTRQAQLALSDARSKARRATILSSIFASGPRMAMAAHLADHTEMSTEDAIAVLKVSNQSSAPKVPTIAERAQHASASDIATIGILSRGHRQQQAMSWDSVIAKIWTDRKEATK